MPTKLDPLLNRMYTQARSAYDRAVENAKRLGHGAVGDTHLLLGVLALGNSDPLSPVPRILRDAGASYEKLRAFLESRTELRGHLPASFKPEGDALVRRTLTRALRNARGRAHGDSRDAIIMADLAVGLMKSRDPLFEQALQYMGVDRMVVRQKLTPSQTTVRPRHLQPIQ